MEGTHPHTRSVPFTRATSARIAEISTPSSQPPGKRGRLEEMSAKDFRPKAGVMSSIFIFYTQYAKRQQQQLNALPCRSRLNEYTNSKTLSMFGNRILCKGAEMEICAYGYSTKGYSLIITYLHAASSLSSSSPSPRISSHLTPSHPADKAATSSSVSMSPNSSPAGNYFYYR
ncbi:hypothetical protein V9T40_005343 [Parthenolecanium corni]|uniref:Uncharacterized protein n=1 Tax=Parthenolecanium corni TaxID=536013 RepID=A0AAN9Y382_9HEMI